MNYMKTTALADIKALFTPAQTNFDDPIHKLQLEISELKPQLRELAKATAPLEALYEQLKQRKRYLPGDRKLSKEFKQTALALADAKSKQSSASEIYKQLKLRIDNLYVARRAQELEAQAHDYDFLSPFNSEEITSHTLEISSLMSAICENLQYQYISGNRYYHWLIDQCAKQQPNGDTALGANDMAIPEIEDQWNTKLDTMRERREYLMVLRIAAERAYKHAIAELPPDSPFTPRMLRLTDEQLEQQLNTRNQQRWQAKQDQQKAVATAEHAHARKEDKVYTPRL